MVSFRLDGSGTHLGPVLGVNPTGRTIRIRGIHHVRLRDGRIVEHWQGPETAPCSSTWAGSHRPPTDELGPLIPVLASP